MSKPVILLTCTVNVKGMAFTELTDNSIREQHYLDAINYYFFRTSLKIVVVENTNHSFLSKVSNTITNSERLEILTFDGNNFPKHKGKGYGELESISYTMNHSRFICEDTPIIKITGRYKVFNINTFIKAANKIDGNICQFLYFKGQLKAFSGIFIANKIFFVSYLEPNHKLMNDSIGVYFEHILAKSILDYIVSGSYCKLLVSFPRLIGISGTENVKHKTNKFSFWLAKEIIYRSTRFNFLILDRLILRFFQN
jgi:hypothetical protein